MTPEAPQPSGGPHLGWRQAKAMLALPGMATVVVPATLLAWKGSVALPLATRIPLGALGVALLLAGLTAMALTIGLFTTVGGGTLAPWDPTRRLVARGIYRHVRNPMISGVFAVLLGEAALAASPALLAWFLAFVAGNLAWIPLVEEPGLVNRFGDAYREYCRHVPRWLPRRTPWTPPGSG